jgi:hypothetical protein
MSSPDFATSADLRFHAGTCRRSSVGTPPMVISVRNRSLVQPMYHGVCRILQACMDGRTTKHHTYVVDKDSRPTYGTQSQQALCLRFGFGIAVCYVDPVASLCFERPTRSGCVAGACTHKCNIVFSEFLTMKLLSVATALIASSSALAFAPAPVVTTRNAVSMNMAAAEEYYIDEERRFVMNLILVGSTAVTVGALGIPYIAFFFPPGPVGGGGGVAAKDALGNDLFLQSYLETHPAGDRSLAQGLKGDAT